MTIKHALAATMFTAGLLFAGGAMAQTPTYTPQTYAPQSYTPQSYTPGETYTSQSYTPQRYAPTGYGQAWQYNNAAAQRTEAIGDTYTHALNDLYAHGFHAVHDMSMQDGMVQATATPPHGVHRTIDVNPGTDRISIG